MDSKLNKRVREAEGQSYRETKKAKVDNSLCSDLCDEILFSILSLLPLKSLGRAACVSKTWRRWVSEIGLKKPSEPMFGGLFYEYETLDTKMTGYAPLPSCNERDGAIFTNSSSNSIMQILSCSHGLILCIDNSSPNEYHIINPLMTPKIVLPRSTCHSHSPNAATLVLDPSKLPNYEVVRLITDVNNAIVGVDVFSSKTSNWEELELTIDDLYYEDGEISFLNGTLYVLAMKDSMGVLFTYNIMDKIAQVISLPCQGLWDENPNCLGVSQGCLRFSANDFVEGDDFVQHLIWELEGQNLWVLKHRLGPLDHQLLAFHPDLDAVFFHSIDDEQHNILVLHLTNMEWGGVCTFYDGDEVDVVGVSFFPISPSLLNPAQLGRYIVS
ncbi:hypothetical protein QJS10_CPA02g00799 [Acorus calamus]|uniref:F-box domain-containing protein n=1 Tax=Acorus calamus TaxID=4465 RepID=A0AAV9FF54_ACOCL|nr:hypothetical protein QJS10_CPA02g00799 [Acorus calamus]